MTSEELTFMYYKNANSLLRIAFDKKSDPSYCEIFDPKTGDFVRRNEILDEILNDHETVQLTEEQAQKILRDDYGYSPKIA
jgi:hypothetical protein